MSRERMLADIRRALERPVSSDHHYPVPPRSVAPAPTFPSLLAEFRARFEALGGRWHEAADGDGVARVVEAIVGPAGGPVLVASDPEDELDRLGVADALAARGVAVVRSLAAGADKNAIPLAVTTTSWAIADSGTFGVLVAPGQGRLASVITPIHLVVLRPDRIVATLGEFLTSAAAALTAGTTSAALLITGPSRTGDIEGQLIVGVHGPGEIHCVPVS